MSGQELDRVAEAISSNWVAPLGPHVDALEREFADAVGSDHAVALSSGTAALHLALRLAGVDKGDEVLVSTLTFVASASPVLYQGARPVFIDSERASWNVDPVLIAAELEERERTGRLPAAIVVTHLYGQSASMGPIVEASERLGVPVIEDAAEALGASYQGRAPGSMGRFGVFSFNGNKIITASSGGMLVTADGERATRARKLATQARDPAPHYEHSEVGYNYRMSNVLAGIARAQLEVLEERVRARRAVFDFYRETLGDLPGLEFQPEAAWGRHTRWLTTLTIDPPAFGADREDVRQALEAENIEARPVWKPMHLQPLFEGCERVGGEVAEELFERGLCLPSGSSLSRGDLERIAGIVRGCAGG